MLMNGFENEKLFAKTVPVTVKNVSTNQSRIAHLFLEIEWKEASAGAGMYNDKILSLTLTDDDDIYFLYKLEMNEEDFQKLKTNLSLVTNFASFPQWIIDYIEKCLCESDNPQQKYLLVFKCNDYSRSVAVPSQLDIIESNNFRELSHISLIFHAATPSFLKQHQIASFKHLKEANRQLKNKLNFVQKDLESKNKELDLERKKLSAELFVKDSDYQKALKEERERLTNRYEAEINRLEQEIKTKEVDFRKDNQQLESRVNVLDTLNKELQENIFKHKSTIRKHESTIRELNSKVLSFEDEVKCLKENLQIHKNKYDRLQSELKDKEEQILRQEETIYDLKQNLRYEEQSVLKLNEQLEAEMTLKRSVEKDLEDLKFNITLRQKEIDSLNGDKEKLNDMIVNLQERVKTLVKENKSKDNIVAKYKNAIDEKDRHISDAKQEITRLNNILQEKNAEVRNLNDKIRYLEEKIEDLKNDLKENNRIVKWLNKKLTENGIVPLYNSPDHLVTSPSTIPVKELFKINPSHKDSSPLITRENAASKSVRKEAASPAYKEGSSIPPHSSKTTATDSAYCTASLHTNQDSPQILAGCYNVKCNPSDFECDQEALKAAFGDGRHILKHSTAKKTVRPSKPINSSTPKSSKKR